MNIKLKRYGTATAVAVGVLLCAGCGNTNGTATINYTQVGACNGWKDGGILHSAGPNQAYVVFKVQSIDNTQGKVNFSFDPSKMAVNTGSHPHMDPSLSLRPPSWEPCNSFQPPSRRVSW